MERELLQIQSVTVPAYQSDGFLAHCVNKRLESSQRPSFNEIVNKDSLNLREVLLLFNHPKSLRDVSCQPWIVRYREEGGEVPSCNIGRHLT